MLGGDREAFRHHLPIEIDIAGRIEEYVDDREALYRGRGQFLDSGNAIDLRFDWRGHQHLDLFRRQARRFRLDAHLRRGELGKHIVFRAQQTEDAVAEQQKSERDNDAAKADGEGDDGRLQTGRAGARRRGHF